VVAYAALHPFDMGRYSIAFAAVNYAWVLVDPAAQFLHDRIAGTRIALTPPEGQRRPL
jgi:hypothetical protein